MTIYQVQWGSRGRTGARELGGNGADPEPTFTVEAEDDEHARILARQHYLNTVLTDPTEHRHPRQVEREFDHDNAIIRVSPALAPDWLRARGYVDVNSRNTGG